MRGIAVSVNAEYASQTQVLHEGDEVGLLPPVSGGAQSADGGSAEPDPGRTVVIALTREPIDAKSLVAAAKRGEDGAVVVFDGIVRNNTRGRQTLCLDYEAYEEMAQRQMEELAREACCRFGVRSVSMVHRLGRLEVGETSVLIVVASAHRAQAFDGCRWLIDMLKKQCRYGRKRPLWTERCGRRENHFPRGWPLMRRRLGMSVEHSETAGPSTPLPLAPDEQGCLRASIFHPWRRNKEAPRMGRPPFVVAQAHGSLLSKQALASRTAPNVRGWWGVRAFPCLRIDTCDTRPVGDKVRPVLVSDGAVLALAGCANGTGGHPAHGRAAGQRLCERD